MGKNKPVPIEILEDDWLFLRTKERPAYEGREPVRIVDLFAGCGGFTLGLAEACRALGRGIDIRLAVERDADVWKIYLANFGTRYRSSAGDPPRAEDELTGALDVSELFDGEGEDPLTEREAKVKALVGRVDVCVGGPPCQGHSDLNNHTRRKDPKNALYERMVRAARVLEPRTLFIENVVGLRHDKGGVLQRAEAALRALGYTVSSAIVKLIDLGVPQLRKRHLLLATKTGVDLEEGLKKGRIRKRRNLKWAIGDLNVGESDRFIDRSSKLSPENVLRAQWLKTNKQYDLPNDRRPKCHKEDPEHTYKSMYGRLRWGSPAQTITSGFGSPGQGRYLHPEKLRTLTPHEAARIQFLPDWFDFSSQERRSLIAVAIGNAVPPKLGFILGLAALSDAPAVAKEISASATELEKIPLAVEPRRDAICAG